MKVRMAAPVGLLGAQPWAELHCLARLTDVPAPNPASPTAVDWAARRVSWPLRSWAEGRRRMRGVDLKVGAWLRPDRPGQQVR